MDLQFGVWDIVDNKTLYDSFQCRNCGGMRRSHRTNTLVLISDHTKSIYADGWDYSKGLLKYSGEGQVGDQKLAGQNKTLAESKVNGVEIHLFEVFVQGKYLYEGIVTIQGEPFQEIQLDIHKTPRMAWVFNLMINPVNLASLHEHLLERRQWINRLGFDSNIIEDIS